MAKYAGVYGPGALLCKYGHTENFREVLERELGSDVCTPILLSGSSGEEQDVHGGAAVFWASSGRDMGVEEVDKEAEDSDGDGARVRTTTVSTMASGGGGFGEASPTVTSTDEFSGL